MHLDRVCVLVGVQGFATIQKSVAPSRLLIIWLLQLPPMGSV